MSIFSRAGAWLEDRTGWRAGLAHALEEPVPGGASPLYVFGSVLTFILILQITTGIFLALYYSPSSTDAWASVAYIQDQVTMGWFVRGLHHYGASAMVIVSGLHLLQTAVYGAYKKPREVNWLLGCLMLALVLAFALTGYLLPWDQTGYWATKVATGIAGGTPLAGDQIQAAVQGGNEYGNLTITRFFTLHVFILPGSLLALLGLHVALFRKHGVTPRWDKTPEQLEAKMGRFWPDQMFIDMVAIALVFAAIAVTVLVTGGARLDAPADPSSNFDARPEWYFRPLFQALKYFHGPLEKVVALGLPVILGAIFIALPFVDRREDRSPRRRWKYLTPVFLVFLAAGALTAVSFREDSGDAKLQKRLAKSERQAEHARELAKTYGVPAAGGTAVYSVEPDTTFRGRYAALGPVQSLAIDLWKDHCAHCHEGKDRDAPVIEPGYNTRAWIRGFLTDPDGPEYMGKVNKVAKSKHRMKAVEIEGADLDAVVEYIYSLGAPGDVDADKATRGQGLFEDGSCSDCHDVDPDPDYEAGGAPNLVARGSLQQISRFIGNPRPIFGKLDDMKAFGKDLTLSERTALAEYVVWLRTQK